MMPELDFADPPAMRRRRPERAFYRALAVATLLGALPVLLLAWRVDHHTAHLQAATALLEREWHTLQPSLAAVARAEQAIAALSTQHQRHAQLAARRATAPALLAALATASTPGTRLLHLGLREQHAQLRGWTPQQDALQAFSARLDQAGVGRVALHELRTRNAARPQLGYVFMLSVQPAASKAP